MLVVPLPVASHAKPNRGPKLLKSDAVPAFGTVNPDTLSPGKNKPGGALTKCGEVVPFAYSSGRNCMLRSFRSVIGVYGSQRSPKFSVSREVRRNVSPV